jgi:hypothetical protein
MYIFYFEFLGLGKRYFEPLQFRTSLKKIKLKNRKSYSADRVDPPVVSAVLRKLRQRQVTAHCHRSATALPAPLLPLSSPFPVIATIRALDALLFFFSFLQATTSTAIVARSSSSPVTACIATPPPRPFLEKGSRRHQRACQHHRIPEYPSFASNFNFSLPR